MVFSQNQQFVQQLYIAYYGRPGDRAGLDYWAERLEQEGEGGVVNAFGESQEFNQRYGSFDEPTLVNNLYQQLFGRDADEAGLAYYVDQLSRNIKSLAEIARTISEAAQDRDQEVVLQRLEIADAYTAKKAEGGFDATTAEQLLKRVTSSDDDLQGITARTLDEIEDMLDDAFDDIEDAIEDMLDELEDIREEREDALEDAQEVQEDALEDLEDALDDAFDDDDDSDADDADDAAGNGGHEADHEAASADDLVLDLDDETLTVLLHSDAVTFDDLTLTQVGDEQRLTANLHYGEQSFRVEIDDDTAAFAELVGQAAPSDADAAVIA